VWNNGSKGRVVVTPLNADTFSNLGSNGAAVSVCPNGKKCTMVPQSDLMQKKDLYFFDYVQFPMRYWYPQDHRGIVDRTTFMHGVVVQVSQGGDLLDPGRFFNYSPDSLMKYFGIGPINSVGVVLDEKQCRRGVEIYKGKIKVFLPSLNRNYGYHGQREPQTDVTDRKDGDILVKISDDCKPPSTPLPWPSTSADGIFTLVNPTSGKALGLAGTGCQGASIDIGTR
jgi:hypothetical protein